MEKQKQNSSFGGLFEPGACALAGGFGGLL
jgi:hypothetical protein